MRRLSSTVLLCVVTGCASISDVVSTGQGTYMVSSHGVMGHSSAGAEKAAAFEKAGKFCKSLGKTLQSIGTQETPSGFGRIASGEVQFRCVD